MIRKLGYAAILCLLCSISFAQTMKVRIVNAKTLEPIAKQSIQVSWLSQSSKSTTIPPQVYQTDGNGEVMVQIPAPAPDQVSVRATLRPDHWRCACMALASTEDVINKGILVTIPAGKSAEPKRGEVILMAYPLSFFERLLYPLVKG